MKSKSIRPAAIISEPIAWVSFQILVFASPGPYPRTFFLIFDFFVCFDILRLFFVFVTWDPMGAKFQNATPATNRSRIKVFKLFLNFLPNGPHKTFGIFEI